MTEVFANVVAVLPAFTVACLVLAVLPGPATALYLHRTMRDGRAAGLAAVLASEIGLYGWVLAAGAGLTALLTANRVLFTALHVIGAAVLVYLGISAWRSARKQEHSADGSTLQAGLAGEFGAAMIGRLPSGRGVWGAFRASLVSIAANPKAAAFAFSFFPQFLPRHGAVFATTAVLGLIQVILDSAYCVALVLLAARVKPWLSRATIRRRLERILGAVLVGLGIQLAVESR